MYLYIYTYIYVYIYIYIQVCVYVCVYVYVCIHIYIYTHTERHAHVIYMHTQVLLRGIGTLGKLCSPDASVWWQPDGLTIHTENWLPGAGFLGTPPTYLIAVR